MLVKATNETSTDAETTKTEDHKAQLEEVFNLKGTRALPSNKEIFLVINDLDAFLFLYVLLVPVELSSSPARFSAAFFSCKIETNLTTHAKTTS